MENPTCTSTLQHQQSAELGFRSEDVVPLCAVLLHEPVCLHQSCLCLDAGHVLSRRGTAAADEITRDGTACHITSVSEASAVSSEPPEKKKPKLETSEEAQRPLERWVLKDIISASPGLWKESEIAAGVKNDRQKRERAHEEINNVSFVSGLWERRGRAGKQMQWRNDSPLPPPHPLAGGCGFKALLSISDLDVEPQVSGAAAR